MMERKTFCLGAIALWTLFSVASVRAATKIDGAIDSPVGTPGVWNKNFTNSLDYATKNHIPVLMYYGSTGCGFCATMAEAINLPEFREWMREHPIILIYKHPTPNEITKLLGATSAAKSFDPDLYLGRMWVKDTSPSIPDYPRMRIWWTEEKGTVHNVSFCGRANSMPVKTPSGSTAAKVCEKLIASLNLYVGAYIPKPAYAGGFFAATNAPYASLEAEATTKRVDVEIVRTATAATNQVMVVSYPTEAKGVSTVAVTNRLTWAEDQLCQTNRLANFDKNYFAEGRTVTLQLLDDEGEVMSETVIRCETPENSAANPLWLGERKSPYANGVAPNLQFGEWTMDIDLATQVVAKASGVAYTLVSIQGSKWCPDCANTDRNFLEVKDGSGNNKFRAWAKSKNVALVSMDIPNYNASGSTPETVASPTLFSKRAFSTTLARNGMHEGRLEVPAVSGADPALTNAMARSGLGYLTRKGATDAEAAAVMKKFHDLAVTNTDKGGFHRPEDGNKYRTGVPIFVLLRKGGSVAARFTRFASVSPMAADRENFDSYIKRFEEMLEIAKNDSTEIENNYPSAGSISFAANGGSANGSLSHADQVDTFRLSGVGGNAIQNVTVKGVAGSDTAEVEVSFFTTNATGEAVLLGTPVTSNLTDGVSANYTFTQAGSYFVQVKGKSVTSDEFRAESENSTVQNFTVSGAVVLVPQEDEATANAPEGSTKVLIRLVEGTVYRMSGLSSCAALESTGTAGFYRATAGGDVEADVTEEGGALTYQIWNPGSIGFSETSREVKESVCDPDGKPIQFTVKRTGGKSGEIRVLVTTNLVSLADYRYEFNPTNLVWSDGDESDRFVDVLIKDDLLFDGKGVMRFTADITSSTGGDATVAPGKGEFTLTVTEDDIQRPGKAFVMAAEPDWTKKLMVYAPETEGMKFWATREEGSDGLAAATLVSSVGGTKFETADPRDLTDVADEYPEIRDYVPEGASFLWWSSRESGEKWVKVSNIPAGKTARITFKPIRPLGTVSASNVFTIVSVADDAPGFSAAEPIALTRYVASSNTVSLTNLSGNGKVTVAKLSGAFPAGLKVAYDESAGAMAIFGVPTAKAGTYAVVCQARQVRNGKTVSGIPAKFVITVEDKTSAAAGEAPKNPALAKTRTFKNVMAIGFDAEADTNRLAGILQVTIPPTGRLSAKYTSATGTVSFSAKNWDMCEGDNLWATLAATSKKYADYSLRVGACADGSVVFALDDPTFEETIWGKASGETWSKENPAEAWKGYYTVALPTGSGRSGYLTLKMNTTSACRSGSFTVAGMYPNGTAFSGSGVLIEPEADDFRGWATLPIFKVSSKDVFAAVAAILKDDSATTEKGIRTRRCVEAGARCAPFWSHFEKDSAFEERLGLYGSYYDANHVRACCEEGYETTNLGFLVNGTVIAGVVVGDSTVKIDTSKDNPCDAKLSFARSTGVISGSYKDPANLSSRLSYKGIVVNGWGEGCGCGEESYDVYLPFMSGASTTKGSSDSVTIDGVKE